MPRVSRNTVEFSIEGHTYVVKFIHEHAEKGIQDKANTDLRYKHVTTCRLSIKPTVPFTVGVSSCSLKDTYSWKVGIKQSFIRALVQRNVKVGTKQFGLYMNSFFTELRRKDYYPHRPQDKLMKVCSKCAGTTVRVTSPSGNVGTVPIRGFMPEPRPTGAIPMVNQHGLGYTGAD